MPDALLDSRQLVTPGPTASAPGLSDAGSFTDQVRNFRDLGRPSAEIVEGGIPYLVNEYWTSGQRQSHSLHEISYRACFKAQLPEFFIKRLTRENEGVYDPFMGRGTTPVQAALMGRRPMGNDINPLSTLLARPRLTPPTVAEVERRLDQVAWNGREHVAWNGRQHDDQDLLAFYSPATLSRIIALRHWLIERTPVADTPDPVDDWIRMVALNRLTGHSPGFFSVYTLPPNQAASAEAQRKINAARGQTPPGRDVRNIILKKTKSLLRHGGMPRHPEALMTTAPAYATPHIATGSVALVVTSPPFVDIVQYAADNWLRSWFAGIDPAGVRIAQHRTEAAWQGMVKDTLAELARLVRPGGHIAFEVGEVRGGKLLLDRLVWEAASGLPFDRLFVMVNQQEFTKTANCWGVQNNIKGTNTNRIVVLRRHHT